MKAYCSRTKSRLEPIRSWTEKAESNGISAKLARVLLLSTQGAIHCTDVAKRAKPDKRGQPQKKLDRSQPLNAWQSEMIKLIEDPEQPIWIRMGLAEFMIGSDPALGSTGVWPCVQVIGEGLAKGLDQYSTRQFALEAILECKQDESFQDNALKFSQAWQKATRKASSARQYYSQIGDDELVKAIQLLTDLNQRSAVTRLASSPMADFDDIDVIVVLIRNGYHQMAKKLLVEFWSDNDISYATDHYDKELHDALPDFLEKFDDEGTRLTAEIFLASLADAVDEKDRFEMDRDKRLKTLVERFENVEFKSLTEQLISLHLVSRVAPIDSTVGKLVEQKAAKIQLLDMFDSSGRSYDHESLMGRNLDTKCAWIAMNIRADNYQPLIEVYKKINSYDEGSNDWSFENFVETIESRISDGVMEKIVQSNPDQIKKMISSLQEISDTEAKHSFGGPVIVLASVIGGQTETMAQRLKEKVAKQKAGATDGNPFEEYSGTDLSEIMFNLKSFVKKNKIDDESRIKYVKDVWKLAGIGNFSIGSGHFETGVQQSCEGCSASNYGIDEIVEFELMSKDELMTHGKQMAEDLSVGGETWRQLGKLFREKKQYNQAAECFQKAVDLTEKDSEMAKMNRMLELADSLHSLKKDEEAKKLVDSINSRELFDDNLPTYKKLKSILK